MTGASGQAAVFGFVAGAAFSVALSAAQLAGVPWWLRGPALAAGAAFTLRWAVRWTA
jgi:hypothetical protein